MKVNGEDMIKYKEAVFHRQKDGSVLVGNYARGTFNFVPAKKSKEEKEKADDIMESIAILIKSFKIKTYSEKSDFGLFRRAIIKQASNSGQIMVILITASPIFPSKNNFVKALLKLQPEITTIVQNINEKHGITGLGDREQVLYGKGFIEDEMSTRNYRIYPKSVRISEDYQIPTGLKGEEVVVDAFCGNGMFGICLADKVKEIIGVDYNRQNIREANTNAKINDIKNITFYSNEVGIFFEGLIKQRKNIDILYLHQQKREWDKEFMDIVKRLAPKKIVYL